MERMRTTTKGHGHPSVIDQIYIITRDVGLTMTMAATRTTRLPQGIREVAKWKVNVGTAGTAEEMIQEEIDQETLTHHPMTSLMGHAAYITHTSMGRGFPIT
jgi:hypothetical protein